MLWTILPILSPIMCKFTISLFCNNKSNVFWGFCRVRIRKVLLTSRTTSQHADRHPSGQQTWSADMSAATAVAVSLRRTYTESELRPYSRRQWCTRASGLHYPSWRPESTGVKKCTRVRRPSTRPVNSGSGNRPLAASMILYVCLSVCPHDKTKTAESKFTELAIEKVHHDTWPTD